MLIRRVSRPLFMVKKLSILLLVPALLAQSASGLNNSKGRSRGKKAGTYSLVVAGNYTGTGSATVTDTLVSITANVTFPSGTNGTITFSNLALTNDHFQGSITQAGTTLKIFGR